MYEVSLYFEKFVLSPRRTSGRLSSRSIQMKKRHHTRTMRLYLTSFVVYVCKLNFGDDAATARIAFGSNVPIFFSFFSDKKTKNVNAILLHRNVMMADERPIIDSMTIQ